MSWEFLGVDAGYIAHVYTYGDLVGYINYLRDIYSGIPPPIDRI